LAAKKDAAARIQPHLAAIVVKFIVYEHLSVTRMPGEEPQQLSMTWGVEQQWTSGTDAIFRVKVDANRNDLHCIATVVIGYTLPDADGLWQDSDVAQVFAERVVIPAVYPYVRERFHHLSLDTGARPLLLGVLDPTSVALHPNAPSVAGDS